MIGEDCDFSAILEQFPEVIGKAQPKPITDSRVFHYMQTTGPPIAQKNRRLLPEKLKVVKEEFSRLCGLGIVRPLKSPWASPIHLLPKQDSWRICGDYRRVNSVTKSDKYPVKLLHDFPNFLHGKTVFSTLGLKQAYYQIPVAPEHVEKTAVITPHGLFEYLFMNPGLKGASQTFQRYGDRAVAGLDFVYNYLDDFLIAS